jgi:hypothetical protein
LSYFFKELVVCKLYASRPSDNELFIVGKGFKGCEPDHPYLKALTTTANSMFDANKYPKPFLSTVIKLVKDITHRRTEYITEHIELVHKCLKHKGVPNNNPTVSKYYDDNNDYIKEWYALFPIIPIDDEKKLKLKYD